MIVTIPLVKLQIKINVLEIANHQLARYIKIFFRM